MDFQQFYYHMLDKLNNTSKNLVIVAPTGSGKTSAVVAHMAMNTSTRFLYVSPLKVLCEEVYNKLLKFGVQSDLILGDTWVEAPEAKHRVVVSTYEKADSMVRRGYKWLNPDTIIIDEFHNMSDRQAVESLVLYALSEGKRLVLLSATVANVKEIAEWIKADIVSNEERFVPLYKGILYRHTLYGNIPEKYVNTILNDPLEFAYEKTIMVFVKSRWSAVKYYRDLEPEYRDLAVVFHGGLEPERRKEVLDMVMSGKKHILITTTALGQGVNLPVWMIIFEDTLLPHVKNGTLVGWRYLTVNEFNQIAGRAGRPGFDTEGIVLVKAYGDKDFEIKKKYLEEQSTEVRRSLPLEDYLLTVIHRVKPTHEQLVKYAKVHTDSEEEIEEAIRFLLSRKLVTVDNAFRYATTEMGKALILAYVSIDDGLQIVQDLTMLKNTKITVIDALRILSTNQKVLNVSRGQPVYSVLYNYISGADIHINISFTKADFENLLNTARWIANAMYRVAKALGIDITPFEELVKRLDYGVPPELFELYEAVQNRWQVIQLASHGIKTVTQLCKHKEEAEEIIGGEKTRSICENVD